MNRLTLIFAYTITLIFSAIPGAAQTTHPPTFVDRGACPFECCTYQRWTVTKDTVAYENPNKSAKHVGVFKKGSRVRGLTGEVRTTQPGKYVITKPHEKYKPGNILWVYTPQGEGFYKVWFAGKMRVEEMDYMSGPYEQSGINCDERADCWGHLETDLKTDWWVKVRSTAGWIGWTNQTENFHGMDKCGG
jgi:hypothetical protein